MVLQFSCRILTFEDSLNRANIACLLKQSVKVGFLALPPIFALKTKFIIKTYRKVFLWKSWNYNHHTSFILACCKILLSFKICSFELIFTQKHIYLVIPYNLEIPRFRFTTTSKVTMTEGSTTGPSDAIQERFHSKGCTTLFENRQLLAPSLCAFR